MMLMLAVVAWLSALGVFNSHENVLKSLLSWQLPENTVVFDRDGKRLGELYRKDHMYYSIDRIPKFLKQSVIAIEDRSFLEHKGFDLKAIVRASLVELSIIDSKYRQGGSTITQQVIRHFLLGKEKSLHRKVQEIGLAYELEKLTEKDKILEIYLNTMYLGNGAYGVGAAAKRYFARPLDRLLPHEHAVIAGLFQSPSRFNPVRHPTRAKKRQLQVLAALETSNVITHDEFEKLKQAKLRYRRFRNVKSLRAPYFVDYVQMQAAKILGTTLDQLRVKGLKIYTTLDLKMQRRAKKAFRASSVFLKAERRAESIVKEGVEEKPDVEGALLTIDSKTGEILTMIGGRNYGRSQFNRATQALRSPGSAFKPIVFAAALSKGRKWSDVSYVSPISVGDHYRPRNVGSVSLTETTLLRAFYKSLNTVTVELAEKVGLEYVLRMAAKFGVRSHLKKELGTAIGGSDVNLLDLARVYSVFANQGVLTDLYAIEKIVGPTGRVIFQAKPKIKRSKRVLDEELNFLMVQGMRDVLRHGTGFDQRKLAKWVAGKTGTSDKAVDNWFCGFSDNLTTIVWVGTDQHTPISGHSNGAVLALPLWSDFMSNEIKLKAPKEFEVPAGVVEFKIDPRFGTKSPTGVSMWFLRNNPPSSRVSGLERVNRLGSFRNVFD